MSKRGRADRRWRRAPPLPLFPLALPGAAGDPAARMKRRRNPLLVLALLAVAGMVALFFPGPRGPEEPVHDGRPLSAWIDQDWATVTNAVAGNPYVRDANAQAALRSVGTNALPWLLHEFSRPARPWKDRLNTWVRARTGRPPPFASELTRIRRARNGLNFLGTNLAPVLPRLTRWLGDPDRGYMVPPLLAQAGPAGLDQLTRAAQATNHFDFVARSNCLRLLSLLAAANPPPAGTNVNNVLPALPTNALARPSP